MLQARIWFTIALALALPTLAAAETARPVATFLLGKRGEWILSESGGYGGGNVYVRETEQGLRVDEDYFVTQEPLYIISREGDIQCLRRHPLLKTSVLTPTRWDMHGTKLDPAQRPDPMNGAAYAMYMASALGPPGVYMPGEKLTPSCRPENALGWAWRLHDDTLYAPRQNAPRRGSVCWFIRTPVGLEVRDFTEEPKGELLVTITRDRAVHFSSTLYRRPSDTGPAYWPFATQRRRMSPLFEETHWNWLEDNPNVRYFRDGRVEGREPQWNH